MCSGRSWQDCPDPGPLEGAILDYVTQLSSDFYCVYHLSLKMTNDELTVRDFELFCSLEQLRYFGQVTE